MRILNVYNVGQGDSMMIVPPDDCTYCDQKIFVDLGPGMKDITLDVEEDDNVTIFLTHHDKDHIGGMKWFAGKMDRIKEIIVPFYQNEITLIAKIILGLKGMGYSKNCVELISRFEDIIENQVYLKGILRYGKRNINLRFFYEGCTLCEHIECLNPPLSLADFDWAGINPDDFEKLIGEIHELFEKRLAGNLEIYLRACIRRSEFADAPMFNEITLFKEGNGGNSYMSEKGKYIMEFIQQNLTRFREFNANPTQSNLKKLYQSFKAKAHDVCLVLKVTYSGNTFLLTGDASKKVFNRFIKNGIDIKADYLKMPHHGSKYNMNKKILGKINPKVAIICHNNCYGRSGDPHPNTEVLRMLEDRDILEDSVKIMLTNDVIKNGKIVLRKKDFMYDDYVEIIN